MTFPGVYFLHGTLCKPHPYSFTDSRFAPCCWLYNDGGLFTRIIITEENVYVIHVSADRTQVIIVIVSQ